MSEILEGASPPQAPSAAPPPSVAPDAPNPVLELMTPLAALALVALFTGRVLAPALKGVSVGTGKLVYTVALTGDVSSQVFAFMGMMTAMVAVLAAARSRLPLGVRLVVLALGGFAVIPTVWALHQPVNDVSAALIAVSAGVLALVVVPSALRAPFARTPGVVIGLVALGGLVRLGAVGLAFQSGQPRFGYLGAAAREVATAALLCDAAAVAVALLWVSQRSRAARPGKLTSPVTLVILAVALGCTRQALAGQPFDAPGIDVLFWRAATHLRSVPEAALPLGFRVFISFLAPLVAVGALVVKDPLGARLGAAVALALAARGAVEMPPCALMLIIAALGTALTASDGRSLWAALDRSAPPGDRR